MPTQIGQLLKKRPIVTITAEHTVSDAARKMAAAKVGATAVVEGDRLVGIITERDVMNKVVAEGRDPKVTRVTEIMTRNVILATADEDYQVCLGRMRQAGIRHLPIVKGDQLLGIVSIRDITFFELEKKDEELKLMTDYIHYVPSQSSE